MHFLLRCRWPHARTARSITAGVPAALIMFVAVVGSLAQHPPAGRLMDQPPFDVLTLDKANESKVYKIFPLRLPNRRVPENPKRTDKVRIKLLDNDEEYDVAWANIAKLEFYEQLVVAEVNKFTGEGKLDDAYD